MGKIFKDETIKYSKDKNFIWKVYNFTPGTESASELVSVIYYEVIQSF
jgi:hypothetical protein